jgi:hypothetical protein
MNKSNAKSQVNKGERNNQLISVANYNVKKMVFADPQEGSVPNSPLKYKRINISTMNPDGSIGDLILPTEKLFSFGVSVNMGMDGKTPNGHSLPLCLWSKTGATTEEKQWSTTFDKIVEHCKDHIMANKDAVGKFDLEKSNLKKLNPMYWKRDKATGKVVDGQGPTLYPKLIADKHKKIKSSFFDANTGEDIDPLNLIGKYCYARACIKIESIFIGKDISLQVKVYEAGIELMDGGMKPLLNRPKNSGRLLTGNATNMNQMADDDGEGGDAESETKETKVEERTGSLKDDNEDEDVVETPKPPVKAKPSAPPAKTTAPPVRKIAKKVTPAK